MSAADQFRQLRNGGMALALVMLVGGAALWKSQKEGAATATAASTGVAGAASVATPPAKPVIFPTATATITQGVVSVALTLELATTAEQLTQGLMGRTAMSEEQGMLFVMPSDRRPCLWMRDTQIPLDAFFLNDTGLIFQVETRQPLTEKLHCAQSPAPWVLELNQEWLARHGLTTGAQVHVQRN